MYIYIFPRCHFFTIKVSYGVGWYSLFDSENNFFMKLMTVLYYFISLRTISKLLLKIISVLCIPFHTAYVVPYPQTYQPTELFYY